MFQIELCMCVFASDPAVYSDDGPKDLDPLPPVVARGRLGCLRALGGTLGLVARVAKRLVVAFVPEAAAEAYGLPVVAHGGRRDPTTVCARLAARLTGQLLSPGPLPSSGTVLGRAGRVGRVCPLGWLGLPGPSSWFGKRGHRGGPWGSSGGKRAHRAAGAGSGCGPAGQAAGGCPRPVPGAPWCG